MRLRAQLSGSVGDEHLPSVNRDQVPSRQDRDREKEPAKVSARILLPVEEPELARVFRTDKGRAI
jgi:hypothetical protein